MDFEKQFENYPTEKLIKIICNQKDYNLLAIQAVEKELSMRDLTADQFQEIKTNVKKQKKAKKRVKKRLEQLQNLLKNIVSTFFRFLNPKAEKSIEDNVEGIATFIVLIAIYNVYNIFDSVYYDGQLYFDRVDYYQIQYWMLSVLIPMIGGVLLWDERQAGWLICFAYLLDIVIVEGTTLFIKFKADLFLSNNAFFVDLIFWLLAGWLFYQLGQKSIRTFLSLKQTTVYLALAIVIIYSSWQSVSLYFHMSSYFY